MWQEINILDNEINVLKDKIDIRKKETEKAENDLKLLISAYGLSEEGNFEGKNVLQRVMDDKEVAEKLELEQEQVTKDIKRLNQLLFTERGKRVPPNTDDKVLVSWNAWMAITFSEAARYLQREDYLYVARKNITFLIEIHLKEKYYFSFIALSFRLSERTEKLPNHKKRKITHKKQV